MDGEPENAASAYVRRSVELLNDEEAWWREFQSTVAPDFIRHDRRRLVSAPSSESSAVTESISIIAEFGGGWPSCSLRKVLAVRGDRLVASHLVHTLPDESELEMLVVTQIDEMLKLAEATYYFDPEDLDLAIAELDRLHDELDRG